jgi:hypothetical protein
MIDEAVSPKVRGFLEVYDVTDGERSLVTSAENSIHFENMSLAMVQSLARKNSSGVYVGGIKSLVFGNGASSVNSAGVITYLSKNTTGENSTLYNQTYSKIIDPNNPQNIDPTRNYMDVAHVSGNLFSDLVIVCTLEFGEPSGQMVVDNATDMNSAFIFDEIGIVNYNGKLLSHVLTHPVQKSLNRIYEVLYTIRVYFV